MRPKPLLKLLQSVKEQTIYPDEILIIDGSTDDVTKTILKENNFKNLKYFLVAEDFRGLTKQRNFGVSKIDQKSEMLAFLDDDTVLTLNYFEELLKTFNSDKEVSGVGGVAYNENAWSLFDTAKSYNKYKYFKFEDYIYKEGQRNIMRNYLGLNSKQGPGIMPTYSHGKTCGFPLNGNTYQVDLLIGMSFAFRKIVFDSIKFSTYFEGYGLYEDADFSLRALKYGKNVINTKLQLAHFHHPSGRPNQYQYGRMVVRNGWYVWKVKNPKPIGKDQFKWYAITILLTLIRFSNIVTTSKRKQAFTEALGRTVGLWSLLFDKPREK